MAISKPHVNQNRQYQRQQRRAKAQQQTALAKKRAYNHSPAIERKRAENAWHTNPLAPIPSKALRHQAMTLMRTLYKPGFSQLSNEEKRVNSISEKRKSDNAYYLNWLTKQSELLGAHEDNARAQVLAAGQQTQQEVQKGWEAVSPELVNASEGDGTGSQLTQTGGPSLLQASAQRGANEIAEQRAQTQDQIGTAVNQENFGSAINMAEIAALEGKRQSDQNENLTNIRNSRQELRQTRASEAAKLYAEGLDKEVQKAQSRAQIAASEATAAIEAKRFGLDAKKAGLEAREFNFERGYKNRKLGFEKLSAKQKHEIEAGNLTVAQAEAANRKRANKIDESEAETNAKKAANEGKRTPAEKAKTREKQLEKNHQIDAQIDSSSTTIHNNRRLRQLVKTNPNKAVEILVSKGANPVAAQAAVDLAASGGSEISKATERALERAGYNGPRVQ